MAIFYLPSTIIIFEQLLVRYGTVVMKKSIVIYLLNTILFVNLTGYMFSFLSKQYVIKLNVSRMIESGENEHLSRLVFSHAAYRALPKFDGGKEFKFERKMYDIESITFTDDSVLVDAYCDEDETDLIGSLLGYFEVEKYGGSINTPTRFNLAEFVYRFSLFTLLINESYIVLHPVNQQVLAQASPAFIAPPPDR
jgi:hypothetical protein